MNISEYMTGDPITVSPETTLPEARRLLNTYHIRHLPVVDHENKLIGIVSDRDLRSAYPSTVSSNQAKTLVFEEVERMTVADIMTTTCVALGPESTLDDALLLFDREKIGGVPVLSESGEVLGFFSMLDLIGAYRRLFGMAEKGSILVGIEDDRRENIVCELAQLLEGKGVRLTRLIRLEDGYAGARIYIRLQGSTFPEVAALLEEKGFVLLP